MRCGGSRDPDACRVRILEFFGSEDDATRGKSVLDDLHTSQHLLFLQPTADELDAHRKAIHGVSVVDVVYGAGNIVHVEVFTARLEIAGKGVDFLINKCDRHAAGRIIKLQERK